MEINLTLDLTQIQQAVRVLDTLASAGVLRSAKQADGSAAYVEPERIVWEVVRADGMYQRGTGNILDPIAVAIPQRTMVSSLGPPQEYGLRLAPDAIERILAAVERHQAAVAKIAAQD